MNVIDRKIKTKKTGKKGIFLFFLLVVLVISATLFGQFYFKNESDNFDRAFINGINISGMTADEATDVILKELSGKKDDIEIELSYEDKKWSISGKDFSINSNLFPIIENAYLQGNNKSVSEKLATVKRIQSQGFSIDVSYKYMFTGFDEKLKSVGAEIEKLPIEPKVSFLPSEKNMFSVTDGCDGVMVEYDKLYELIDSGFSKNFKIKIDVPVSAILTAHTKKDVESNLKLRSKFSTSYSSSIAERKSNIRLALSKFNGLEVLPGEEISFNTVTGDKTKENGYKKANIIVNGLFVEGYGGGVCQASTTLYNAVILSDLEILEVNKHSLPISYVPLAFDAMVSQGYADLKFKNSLDYSLFIKSWGDDSSAYVEIYGKPLDKGITLQRRTEFVRAIPHSGDKIVKDVNGEYEDKVSYKGEYFRLKYPAQGYEANAYLDYYSAGELVDSKFLRHETYYPQDGIIIEGTSELGSGMTLPPNEVKIIGRQKSAEMDNKQVKNQIDKNNPTKYNP